MLDYMGDRHRPLFGQSNWRQPARRNSRRSDLRYVGRLRPGRDSNTEGRKINPRHDRCNSKRRSACGSKFRVGSHRFAISTTQLTLAAVLRSPRSTAALPKRSSEICEFLLTELDVHVIVKMNPPMLGKERLEHLLYEVMGYTELRVNEKAYTSGLQFDESLAICGRLTKRGRRAGPAIWGEKFSNTPEVEKSSVQFFQPSEKIMYLSGAPLHVITLTLAAEFRKAVGAALPISFSAGVDRKNFAGLVACGIVPITTCTDLLKTGGYGRLPPYMHELQKANKKVGAAKRSTTSSSTIVANAAAGGGDPVQAGHSEHTARRC